VGLAISGVTQSVRVAASGAQLYEEEAGALREIGCQGMVVYGRQVVSSGGYKSLEPVTMPSAAIFHARRAGQAEVYRILVGQS
jgi:hypothetical protein